MLNEIGENMNNYDITYEQFLDLYSALLFQFEQSQNLETKMIDQQIKSLQNKYPHYNFMRCEDIWNIIDKQFQWNNNI